MELNQKKKFTAGLSITSNILLTALKIIAGVISGSMSIISEAIHSMSDLLASVLTYFSVVKSSQPADADHPYGHGKYEDMAGFIEGVLILIASIVIIFKSLEKIILGHPVELENNVGIIVMGIAVVMNIIVSSMLFRVAKESGSVSLYADGEHLRTDVYSSLGILIGLVLIKITGYHVLDPIIAIFVGVFIFRAGHSIADETLSRLLDHSLPNVDMDKIESIIDEFSDEVILKPHSLKARQSGPTKDIDFTLQFPKETSLCECHQMCEEIEQRIQEIYENSTVSIHSEPLCYNKDCKNCK